MLTAALAFLTWASPAPPDTTLIAGLDSAQAYAWSVEFFEARPQFQSRLSSSRLEIEVKWTESPGLRPATFWFVPAPEGVAIVMTYESSHGGFEVFYAHRALSDLREHLTSAVSSPHPNRGAGQ